MVLFLKNIFKIVLLLLWIKSKIRADGRWPLGKSICPSLCSDA